jgi:hypothetical protein
MPPTFRYHPTAAQAMVVALAALVVASAGSLKTLTASGDPPAPPPATAGEAPKPRTIKLVVDSFPTRPGRMTDGEALCPEAYEVIGGGYALSGQRIQSLVLQSYAGAAEGRDGWHAKVWNPLLSGAEKLQVQAICAKRGAPIVP